MGRWIEAKAEHPHDVGYLVELEIIQLFRV
jgi:hypothetical protein